MPDANPAPPNDQALPVELLPAVYDELRKLAAARLAAEAPGNTLQPTALVHEAYLRLVGGESAPAGWDGKAHFFGAAAEAMRRILVESARRKSRLRHGGEFQRRDLDHAPALAAPPDDELVAVDEALKRLEAESPEVAAVVKLRYFAGMTAEEAANALSISKKTADRRWAYAKAWLFDTLG